MVEGTAVGDGSGGVVSLDTDYPPGYIYSFEGFGAVRQSSVSADLIVTWLPQVVPGGTGFATFHDMGATPTRHVVFGREYGIRLPLSVASPGNVSVRLTMEFDVNTNSVIYRTSHWGYYWDFRAVRTSTGPVRPI